MTIRKEKAGLNLFGEKLVFNPNDSQEYRGVLDALGLALILTKSKRAIETESSDLGLSHNSDFTEVTRTALREPGGVDLGETSRVSKLSLEERVQFAGAYATSLVIFEDEVLDIVETLEDARSLAADKPHLNIPEAAFDAAVEPLSEYYEASTRPRLSLVEPTNEVAQPALDHERPQLAVA